MTRTPNRGLRLAIEFLQKEMLIKDVEEYCRRRDALQRLNFELNVRTVLDGCNAGHNQRYIDLIEKWDTGNGQES